MNEHKEFALDVMLVFVTTILTTIASFILVPLLSKNLTQAHYGVWSQIKVTMSVLVPLVTLSLNRSFVRFLPSEDDISFRSTVFVSALTISLVLSLLVGGMLFFFADHFSMMLLNDSSYGLYFKIASVFLIAMAFEALIISYLRAFRNMVLFSFLSLLKSFGTILFVYASLRFSSDLEYVLVAIVLGFILVDLVGLGFIFRSIGIQKPRFQKIKPYLDYSLPLLFTPLLFWIIQLSDQYVIGFFLSAQEVGKYAVNYSLAYLLGIFIFPIKTILMPAVSKFWDKKELSKASLYIEYAYKYQLALIIPVSFVLCFYSTNLVTILSTSDYVGSSFLMPFLVLGCFFSIVDANIRRILELSHKTNTIRNILIFLASFNILINFLLVPFFGISGAAFSTFLTFFVGMLITRTIVAKHYSFDFVWSFLVKSFFASLCMVGLLYFLPRENLIHWIVLSFLGGGFYFLLLIALKALSKKEIYFFLTLVKLDSFFAKFMTNNNP